MLGEAQAMYRAGGYREIPAYSEHMYAGHWFEKRLTDGGAPARPPCRDG
ncbi:hypothetical protein AB0E88_20590 [Streptomyces sp. NPDC028635]